MNVTNLLKPSFPLNSPEVSKVRKSVSNTIATPLFFRTFRLPDFLTSSPQTTNKYNKLRITAGK